MRYASARRSRWRSLRAIPTSLGVAALTAAFVSGWGWQRPAAATVSGCTITVSGTLGPDWADAETLPFSISCTGASSTPQIYFTLGHMILDGDGETLHTQTLACHREDYGNMVSGGNIAFSGTLPDVVGGESSNGTVACFFETDYGGNDPLDVAMFDMSWGDGGMTVGGLTDSISYTDPPTGDVVPVGYTPGSGGGSGTYDGPTAADFHELEQEVLYGLALLVFAGMALLVGSFRD